MNSTYWSIGSDEYWYVNDPGACATAAGSLVCVLVIALVTFGFPGCGCVDMYYYDCLQSIHALWYSCHLVYYQSHSCILEERKL